MVSNYIASAIENAESKPNNDYHLAFRMRTEMNFFNTDKNTHQWANRLEYFEEIDISQNALVEAVYYYGKWKTEKEFSFIEKSLKKFLEMEMEACTKKWNWVLEECVTQQISLFFKLNKSAELVAIGGRISKYLKIGKDVLPTHIIMKLAKQVIRILDFMKKGEIDELYQIFLSLANDKELNDSFKEGFFDGCIKIKRHYSDEASVTELHRAVLDLKIKKAEEKGRNSKMLLSGLLESALDYCTKYVNDKGITESLKKRISQIDYSDELVPFKFPEELREKLNEAYRKQDEHARKSVSEYIEKIKEAHPIQILYGILNDESIFNMRVEETADFTKKLVQRSVSNIFSTSLDVGFKRKRLENESEKVEYNLHINLESFLIENLNVVYYITSKIQDEKIIGLQDVYTFLSNCEIIDKNDVQIIIWGLIRHCEGDYLSSISILVPKIESTLYRWLNSINADVTSYSTKTISQRALGGLIELPEVADKFSKDFQYFLKLLLVADDSINLRNRLSHGSISISEFNQKVSLIIIFILLKIYAKTFKTSG